ncbi:MAG: acetamidase/formamidase family protein [Ilumatobacteraceae bacterium]
MTRDRTSFYFDPASTAVLTVASGDTVLVETQDAHCGTITGSDVVYATLSEVLERIGGANPVTGPIAVDGVAPGDLLAIELLDVIGAPVTGFGYMNTTSTLHPAFNAETTICRRYGDVVEIPTHRGPVRIPYRPFVGTLGVAPADAAVASFLQRNDILGNVDLPELCSGSTVVLRANVVGGMLSLGDAHLAQGDAEIHRSAVETQADVTLRITNLGAEAIAYPGLPQINTLQTLGSVAPGPGHLEDLVRAAYDDLAARMRDGYGFTLAEAFRLLGAVGTVRIGQVVPPVYSAMAKIERRFLVFD